MEPHEEQLPLAEVRRLAEKGEDLSWDDFGQYNMRILVLDFMFSCMTLMKITVY